MNGLARIIALSLIGVATLATLCGCVYVFGGALKPLTGSGVIKSVETALPASLDKVTLEHIGLFPTVNGAVKFVVHESAERKVVVTADDNILDELNVSVSGNSLVVSGKQRRLYNSANIRVDLYGADYKTLSLALSSRIDLSSEGALKAETLNLLASGMIAGGADIAVKDANFTVSGSGDLLMTGSAESIAYTLSGSAKVDSASISAKDVAVVVSGSGNANVTAQNAVTCTVSGAGTLKAAGAVDLLDVSISGSGKVEASSLVAKKAKLMITGSGNANINVTDALDVTVTGSGNISYIGSPKVTQRITGSGSINSVG